MDESEVTEFRPLRNWRAGPFLFQWRVLSAVRERSYDAVIFTGDVHYISTWIAAMLARIRGANVYFWTIGWHRPEAGAIRAIRLLFYRLAHGLLLYGETGRRIGATLGYPPERMTVIYNSVSSVGADSNPLEERTLLDSLPRNNGHLIGAVIRLTPVKRLDLLIRAAAVLRSSGTDVSVLLVGAGPQESALKDLADGLKVPLSLPGSIYSSNSLRLLYERLELTVVPNAVGLTAIQSLSHGVPVVTHGNMYAQMPEAEAIRPGITGDFYDFGDVDSLAKTVDRWLGRPKEQRDRSAQACRAEVNDRWSAGVSGNRIAAALKGEPGL